MKEEFSKNAGDAAAKACALLDSLGAKYERRQDGVIVVEGDLDLSRKGLDCLPDLSMVAVTGDFDCSRNNLTTLKGMPREVGGYFDCSNNKLTSLEGSPAKVGGLNCNRNKLPTLRGGPSEVEGLYSCEENLLVTLEGMAHGKNASFSCRRNALTTLRGAPPECEEFKADINALPDLRGGPAVVTKTFSCTDNPLSALDGAPKCDNIVTDFGALQPGQLSAMQRMLAAAMKRAVEEHTQAIDAAATGGIALKRNVAIGAPLRLRG